MKWRRRRYHSVMFWSNWCIKYLLMCIVNRQIPYKQIVSSKTHNRNSTKHWLWDELLVQVRIFGHSLIWTFERNRTIPRFWMAKWIQITFFIGVGKIRQIYKNRNPTWITTFFNRTWVTLQIHSHQFWMGRIWGTYSEPVSIISTTKELVRSKLKARSCLNSGLSNLGN